MGKEFTIRTGSLQGNALDEVKRSICLQAERQDIVAYTITPAPGQLTVKLRGDSMKVIAFEAAVNCWFNERYHD